jgi:hypothetical protein
MRNLTGFQTWKILWESNLSSDMDTVYDIKNVYFFDIAYVFEHPNGKDTMIGSGVEDFRSPMKIKEVLKLLK